MAHRSPDVRRWARRPGRTAPEKPHPTGSVQRPDVARAASHPESLASSHVRAPVRLAHAEPVPGPAVPVAGVVAPTSHAVAGPGAPGSCRACFDQEPRARLAPGSSGAHRRPPWATECQPGWNVRAPVAVKGSVCRLGLAPRWVGRGAGLARLQPSGSDPARHHRPEPVNRQAGPWVRGWDVRPATPAQCHPPVAPCAWQAAHERGGFRGSGKMPANRPPHRHLTPGRCPGQLPPRAAPP
jgi:hypothetical protein